MVLSSFIHKFLVIKVSVLQLLMAQIFKNILNFWVSPFAYASAMHMHVCGGGGWSKNNFQESYGSQGLNSGCQQAAGVFTHQAILPAILNIFIISSSVFYMPLFN